MVFEFYLQHTCWFAPDLFAIPILVDYFSLRSATLSLISGFYLEPQITLHTLTIYTVLFTHGSLGVFCRNCDAHAAQIRTLSGSPVSRNSMFKNLRASRLRPILDLVRVISKDQEHDVPPSLASRPLLALFETLSWNSILCWSVRFRNGQRASNHESTWIFPHGSHQNVVLRSSCYRPQWCLDDHNGVLILRPTGTFRFITFMVPLRTGGSQHEYNISYSILSSASASPSHHCARMHLGAHPRD